MINSDILIKKDISRAEIHKEALLQMWYAKEFKKISPLR